MRSLIITLAAVSALAMAAPAHADDARGEAFGIAATGLVPLAASPHVVSTTQDSSTQRLLTLPANPLVDARVDEATASKFKSKAHVTDVAVAQLALRAQAVTATCDNGLGGSALARVAIGDTEIPVYPQPNTGLTVPLGKLGKAAVVLNQQTKLAGGGTRVTAIHLDVVLGGVIKQTLDIASATCADASRLAPAPSSIPGDLAVAG